jgi:hypothetical protein
MTLEKKFRKKKTLMLKNLLSALIFRIFGWILVSYHFLSWKIRKWPPFLMFSQNSRFSGLASLKEFRKK